MVIRIEKVPEDHCITTSQILFSNYVKSPEVLFFLIFFNVYSFFDRQSMSMGGAERGGDTESEVGSRF